MDFLKSTPGADPIVVEGYFAATPAKVFEAWTKPEIVVKWFGAHPHMLGSVHIDLRPGGAWRFLKKPEDDGRTVGFEGEYQEVQPGEKLVFSWSHVVSHESGEREATPFSRVEVLFTPLGNGTNVRLTHSAIAAEQARRGVGGGWEMSFATQAAMFEALEAGQAGAAAKPPVE